jgi:putative transposase
LDVHLILDNYATHKHAKVRTWLAARPRFHLHFRSVSTSLRQVAREFSV